ncbi:putative dro/myosuppressin receptor [Schistosoma mansoni]|uniref:putative dro/myosuppressin receptor n=1 Tax=Schistosoma mansoni TaxID=6183 RepID=UPI0001A63C3A|nr:putative dro/myosuppressin receptor [Schistosoma mansoni]|eukprot:XP_018652359.1 putative dro/myosuppressin receptor [Schistosoma mansoni]
MNECIPSLLELINQTNPLNTSSSSSSSSSPSNNTEPIINYSLIKFGTEFSKIHGPLSLAVCLFGIPANFVNIIVLTRRELSQNATNHLLLWLAVADLLLMILYAPCLYHFYIIHPHPMKNPIYTPSKLWIIYQEIVVSCALMLHSLALWLAVLLALFRYIHVGFPISGSIYTTRKRAFYSALLITIFCIFVAIPNILVNHSESCLGPTLNYKSINGGIWNMKNIAPSFLLTILTILLISELQKAIKRRKALFIHRDKSLSIIKYNKKQSSLSMRQSTSSPSTLPSTLPLYNNDESKKLSRENRTTALLLTIVLCFLVIELPQGILVTCIHLIDQFEEKVYQHLGDLLDFLTLLNESISFIIYTTMSNQFRQTFCNIFCPILIKNKTSLLNDQQTIIQYRQHHALPSKNNDNNKGRQHSLIPEEEDLDKGHQQIGTGDSNIK